MSKPRYRWWGYVKAVIRAYPALDKAMRKPIYPPTTARYSTQPPQAGDGRGVECAVIKKLTKRDMEEYEAVSAAIRETERLPNGKARLKIIDLVYWQGTHTLAVLACRWGIAIDVQEICTSNLYARWQRIWD